MTGIILATAPFFHQALTLPLRLCFMGIADAGFRILSRLDRWGNSLRYQFFSQCADHAAAKRRFNHPEQLQIVGHLASEECRLTTADLQQLFPLKRRQIVSFNHIPSPFHACRVTSRPTVTASMVAATNHIGGAWSSISDLKLGTGAGRHETHFEGTSA